MMAVATVDAKDLASHITITVKTQRMEQWRWRLVVAGWLFRLAALIMWCNIELDFDNDGRTLDL